ncbi:MAG: hypothetical protein ACTSYD_02635 [Candidatus Heimdallarchaeaceae archaeon]
MAECGVKKYDNLPARVGVYDVDAMRYHYWTILKKIEKLKKEKKELEITFDYIIKRVKLEQKK